MLVDDGLLVEAPTGPGGRRRPRRGPRPAYDQRAPRGAPRAARAGRARGRRAGSVVGRVFEQRRGRRARGRRPPAGGRAAPCSRSCARSWSGPTAPSSPAGDAFTFRHILIRDAAYDALPKSERAELHERFADWLERTSASGWPSTRRSSATPRAGLPLPDGAR